MTFEDWQRIYSMVTLRIRSGVKKDTKVLPRAVSQVIFIGRFFHGAFNSS